MVSFERFPVSLENISVDVEVLLWHRELDMVAPCVPARLLGSRIPNCNVTIWPDEGHIGIARHWHKILNAPVS